MRNVLTMKSSGKRRGSVLPVVLSMSIGVGALAAGYTTQVYREHSRERWERDKQQAYFDAWAQMECVASMMKASGYDGAGNNRALSQALARPDRSFVDRDGWLTHVEINEVGGAGSGYYEMVSTAKVEDAVATVSSLCRERQSFSDFVYFVNRHNLGIAGGQSAAWPYADAPEGNIHTNQALVFYFADRHFKDPVTAVSGFQYLAGATAANQYFHGPNNSAAEEVTGLMDVNAADLGLRADTLLNLDGQWDSARVQLRGDRVYVEHWVDQHTEVQQVAQTVPVYGLVPVQQEIFQSVPQTGSYQQANWATRQVWNNVPYQVTITDQPGRWTTQQQQVRVAPFQVWVPNTGGGSSGGAIGGGSAGYWQDVYNYQTQNVQVWIAPVTHQEWRDNWAWRNESYVASYSTITYTYYVSQSYNPRRYQTVQQNQIIRYDTVYTPQSVTVPATLAATHDLPADGTMYATWDITFMPVSTAQSYASTGKHVLDGSFTFSAGDDINIQDSIVYGQRDSSGTLQTPYLNGADRTQEYTRNTAYTGTSVLGLVANDDIALASNLPDQAEINATMLASEGEVRVNGVTIASDGTVSSNNSGNFVKTSYRSLGGVISNQRPVTTFVNSQNQVTRGFQYTKSVYDMRQRTNPPRGFPTLNRPRLLASIVREVN